MKNFFLFLKQLFCWHVIDYQNGMPVFPINADCFEEGAGGWYRSQAQIRVMPERYRNHPFRCLKCKKYLIEHGLDSI